MTRSLDSKSAPPSFDVDAAMARWREQQAEREADEARQRVELGVECLTCRDSGRTEHEVSFPDGTFGFAICEHCERGRTLLAQEQARWRSLRSQAFHDRIDGYLATPARFQGLGFATFPDQASAVLTKLRAWIADHDGQRGLVLVGPFGRGKSTLLIDALRQLVIAEADRREFVHDRVQRLGCFATGTGLLQSLRPRDDGYRRRDSTNEDTLRRYQQVTYLAIDDLGAERLTEWGADRLFEIINERHNELRPMLLSSNLTPNALATRWNQQVGDGESGDRIINRIIESCDVIGFDDSAPNWRMQRKR